MPPASELRTIDPNLAKAAFLARREMRTDLRKWAQHLAEQKGWVIAKHHTFMHEKLQAITDGKLMQSVSGDPCTNLMILMPPGAAKSTHSQVVYIPWFIQRYYQTRTDCRVLACSYAAELIEYFSRECRNIIDENSNVLGYGMRPDTRAVQEWKTTNGCIYRCGGVGAGLSGRRADLALIDDYLGSEQDAKSKAIRDQQWAWYNNDFWPRLKPGAVQVLIANRRHEDDLVGRILEHSGKKWEVIKLPFFAKENDPLGREVGEVLWKEWYTQDQIDHVRSLPASTRAGLYDQEPAPEEGDYFKAEHLRTYTRDQYDALQGQELRIYNSGDWAVSQQKGSDYTCLGPAAMDRKGFLYIFPDLFWKRAESTEVVEAFFQLIKRRNALMTISEKCHISQSWGPFLRKRMEETNTYHYIKEHTPAVDKEIRAQSIRGMMAAGRVLFPDFADWWPAAKHQMLTFPGGKHDDFVDFLSHFGLVLGSMEAPPEPQAPKTTPNRFTMKWIRRQCQPTNADRYGGR